MAQTVLIDTDIFIDFGRDRSEAVNTITLLEKDYQLSISIITAMELYSGCRSKKDLKSVDKLISDIQIQLVTKPISKKAFELMKIYRSSHGVDTKYRSAK